MEAAAGALDVDSSRAVGELLPRQRRLDPRRLAEIGRVGHLVQRIPLGHADAHAPGQEGALDHAVVLEQLRAALRRRDVPPRRHRRVAGDGEADVEEREERLELVDAIEPDRLRHAPEPIRLDVARERQRLVAAHVLELVQRGRPGDQAVRVRDDAERLLHRLHRREHRDRRIGGARGKGRIDVALFADVLQEEHADEQRHEHARRRP